MLEHDERYLLTQEWLEVVRRVWREHLAFDHRGRFFRLDGVQSHPKPWGGGEPLVISAGSSPAGREFAARNADCLFMIVPALEGLAETIAGIRAAAGRPIGVYSSGHVICRPTRRETEEYYHHVVHDHGDWAAGDHLIRAVPGRHRLLARELPRRPPHRARRGAAAAGALRDAGGVGVGARPGRAQNSHRSLAPSTTAALRTAKSPCWEEMCWRYVVASRR
jgi:alkanesulfonate monooxygenase SsuD/methylene tetrahydromethanopterin reductase-like flavin-dependent oxidoreductase (luciferase family)